ncbi:MAG: hypothetical protein R3Y10_12160 [Ferrimonas sp.]
MNEYKSAFLVILYDKELHESSTLSSLEKSSIKLEKCTLTIWNNGPNKLKIRDVSSFEKKGINVNIIETIDNISLSKIYNLFIKSIGADSYIFLDDDSQLTDLYIRDAISNKKDEVSIPIIADEQGNTIKPRINRRVITIPQKILSSAAMESAGSGLILGKEVIKSIEDLYDDIFDERFLFYGVDSTLFLRLNKINTINVNVINGFSHSFSLREENISQFKKMEFSSALGLKLRHYKKYGGLTLIRKVITSPFKAILNKNKKTYIGEIFMSYISGKHYKDRA